MDNYLTPPLTPEKYTKKDFSLDGGSSSTSSLDKPNQFNTLPRDRITKSPDKIVKYSTLPIDNSFLISSEKTNLQFGTAFKFGSPDKIKKKSVSNKSLNISEKSLKFNYSSDETSPKTSNKKSSVFNKIRRLSLSSKKSTKDSGDSISETDSVQPLKYNLKTGSISAPDSALSSELSDSISVSSNTSTASSSKLKFKILKKLSFSKKSKNKSNYIEEDNSVEEIISEEVMENRNNKNGAGGKRNKGNKKWKKISPESLDAVEKENTAKSSENISPSVSTKTETFLETEIKAQGSEGREITHQIQSEKRIQESDIKKTLTAPAQELESTTDNEEYHDVNDVISEPVSVMNDPLTSEHQQAESTQVVDKNISNENTENKSEINIDSNISETKNNSDNSAYGLKKEILSITTPVIQEIGRKKHDKNSKKSSESQSETSSEVKTDKTMSPLNGKLSDKREFLYKILVIGELGAGKTSIIKRYVHQFFSPHYRATIGVDFALKVLNWDQDTIIRIQLWDIAGQERFGNMTRVYYKEAVGAFIVFDVTRTATFDAVLKWKQDLDSKVTLPDGSPIPCVLLANKCDQPKEGIINNTDKINEFIKENNFTSWFETSAKDNINIDEAAKVLIEKVLENDDKVQQSNVQNGSSSTDQPYNLKNRRSSNTQNGHSSNCLC